MNKRDYTNDEGGRACANCGSDLDAIYYTQVAVNDVDGRQATADLCPACGKTIINYCKMTELMWSTKARDGAAESMSLRSDCYVPYGPEWEREMMRLTKPELISLFRETMLAHNAPANVPGRKD